MIATAETPEYLRERLAVLFKLMFWALVALLVFLWVYYTLYDGTRYRELVWRAPRRANLVFAFSGVMLAAMAFVWRVLLVRKRLSITALYRIDLLYSAGVGSAFGVAAYLQSDLRPAAYFSLVYATFTVFARALVVPSSGPRTAVASLATFAPMTVAALALALTTKQEIPPPAFFFGHVLLSVVPIVLATAGSHIIYDLSHRVTPEQLKLGQYTLVRKIGAGEMGDVYLAQHLMLRRPTAVKRLLRGTTSFAAFEREVRRMSQLTHANTAAVYDFGRDPEGVFYYAMEYLDGIDLASLVRDHGAQPVDRVVDILAQICGALHEAHTAGFAHRGVKPTNIILCERGGLPDVAKVIDFGIVAPIAAAATLEIAGDLNAVVALGSVLLGGRARGALADCLAQPHASAAALAEALRALAPIADWDDTRARAWWTTFRSRGDAAAASGSLPALTVDLEDRREVA